MRVLLIMGGWSGERDVSLSGGRKIADALNALGHQVDPFDPATELKNLFDRARGCDFAFINLHGSPGEDGLVQALLEKAGVPYQGSGPEASFLALSKSGTKMVLEQAGLPTPQWELLARPGDELALDFPFPAFVKPDRGGSSLAVDRVESRDNLNQALRAVFAENDAALVERAARGPEVTCSVLGRKTLPLVLIRPAQARFFDYHSKYAPGGAEEVCPAPIDEDAARRVRELSLQAHRLLGLEGYSRADFVLEDGAPLLLEVNTLPGMTPTSLLPQAAAQAGYSFEALIARLMELGQQRFANAQHGSGA
ncbi:MAG: D-alanine--D-alanine ligase family protein [Desulfovibrionaceae bacterium]